MIRQIPEAFFLLAKLMKVFSMAAGHLKWGNNLDKIYRVTNE